jgi:hypothetical protein
MQPYDEHGVCFATRYKRRARVLQFLGASYGKDWVIKTKTRLAGRYTDWFKATLAATDLANAEAKAGRAVQVLTEKDGSTHLIWTYGKNLYPSALGKLGWSKSRGSYRIP